MSAPAAIEFSGRGILLDIEGTTSSVSFVYDVMFPFVRRELDAFLAANWDKPAVAATCERIAQDAGAACLSAFAAGLNPRERINMEVVRLMDGDVKATGLKELQGLIWEKGFESGELRAHVYPDVPLALELWQRAGMDIRIYSSGSVAAQKLFFGHTEFGDLLRYFRGYYDTSLGAKKSAESYTKIAADMKLPPAEILFLSDMVAELNAAREADYTTGLSRRPGNTPQKASGHAELTSFAQILLRP